MLAKYRIEISRIFVVALVIVIVISTSEWDTTKAPFVSTVLFMIGVVLVVSLGRLWCSLYIAGYKKDVLVTAGPYSMCLKPSLFF